MMRNVPVTTTILDFVEPLSEAEKRKLEKQRATGQRARLRAWVSDNLVVAALNDDEIAKSICMLAGLLARSREDLAAFLNQELKPDNRWEHADLIMAWIDYAHFLEETGGNEKKARQRLIEKQKKRIGKAISDGRMANYLSLAANSIALTSFPEHIRGEIEKRLERGQKTSHRGIGVRTNEKSPRKR